MLIVDIKCRNTFFCDYTMHILTFSHPLEVLLIFLQMKTQGVGVVYCLNIGVDPPDVIKPDPCARLECWLGTSISYWTPKNNTFYQEYKDIQTTR